MFTLNRKYYAPDDGGGSGGDSPSGEGGSANASGNSNGGGEAPQIPAGVPEKFWDAKSGQVNYESWGKSTSELQGKLRSIKSDTEKATREAVEAERFANRPETADAYELKVPDSIEMPEGLEFQFNENDPMLAFWRDTVFNNGGDQEMFEQGIEAYINAQFGMMPDYDAEMKDLGEQGQYRAERVNLWAKANLSEDTYGALEEFATTAKGITALEEMMEKAGEPAFSPTTNTSGQPVKSVEDLRKMQSDPRYYDPNKRDPAFVKEIEEGYKKLVS